MPTPPDRDADAPEGQPPVAIVEIDRFCADCGYNLRTQPVRRDPHTNILIVRCPECGAFAAAADAVTAARPWLHRVATVLLAFWMFFMLWIGFLFCLAQVSAIMMTLENRTAWSSSSANGSPAAPVVPVAPLGPVTITKPDGTTVVFPPPGPATPTTTVSISKSKRVVAPRSDDADTILAIALAFSFVLGFVIITGITVAMPHWPRWTYLLPAVLIPLAIGTIARFAWAESSPELLDWGTRYIAAFAAFHLVGGLTAVAVGRSFARLLVMLLLPPRPRAALAYLWLADGKTPPMEKRLQSRD